MSCEKAAGRMTLSIDRVRPRYWFCILLFSLVVIVRAAMVIVWATRLDHRWTFENRHISFYTYLMTFVTTVFSAAILGLSTWALQPLAMHYAFTRPQTLTALHDRASAWLGFSAAFAIASKNLNHRMPVPLLLTVVYFAAAWGISASFSSSFAFESFHEWIPSTPTLYSLTTAITKLGDPHYLANAQDQTALVTSALVYVQSLDVNLRGLGYGKFYDTLATPAPFESRTTVPAIALGVHCGEVPRSNWSIQITTVSDTINLTASATFDLRKMGVSAVFSPTLAGPRGEGFAVYRGFKEADPVTALPSRNGYFLALSNNASSFIIDSENSVGEFFSVAIGSITLHAKVIGCSLTTSNATVIVDGLNRAVNDTDIATAPDHHPWFNAMPMPSRGFPFEDLFYTLYTDTFAPAAKPRLDGMRLSLFEEALSGLLSQRTTLQGMEFALMNGTSFSYAVLGDVYGYANVSSELRAAGWDPKPTYGVALTPVLRARLHLSGLVAITGFVISVIFLATALTIIGKRPVGIDEELIGDPTLLPILLMLYRSPLLATLNDTLKGSAIDETELRRIGAGVNVYVSAEGKLDIVGSSPPLGEKSGLDTEMRHLLGPTVGV